MEEPRAGTLGLAEDLERQRGILAPRCPPYARALELLPAVLDGPVRARLEAAWRGRRFVAFYDRPLLLLAALRADARAVGPSHPLFSAFCAPAPRLEAVTTEALALALEREPVLDLVARRSVQTNETTRAVAWLWPAALAGASGGARPLALADVGASAGLNLVADALAAPWRFADGQAVPVASDVRAVARLGLDATPLDAGSREDAGWLRACVWPGDREREERLEAALAAFAAMRTRPDAPLLAPASAGSAPARLAALSAAHPGALVIAYQTLLRDYLPPDERAEYVEGMRAWIAAQPPGQALWMELELAPGDGELPCTLTAHVRAPRGGVRTLVPARCGYHPTVLRPDPTAVLELQAALC